jgi:hydroxyethylthiazole kinase-like uncharacterized protein yjeF
VGYITPEEMRRTEEEAAARGLGEPSLMENAGAAIAGVLKGRRDRLRGDRVLAVCGLGNNGGDGLVAARLLAEGWRVRVLLLGAATAIKTASSAGNWVALGGDAARVEAPDVDTLARHAEWFSWADVILDCILGTGVRGELREPMATAVRMINASAALKVAVDVPSGLDPLTGDAAAATVRADVTIALHRPKVGLSGKGEYTGEVVVVPIGIQ